MSARKVARRGLQSSALLVAFAASPVIGQSASSDLAPPQHVGLFEGSHAQCILKEMPGVANDIVAQQIAISCKRRYPAGFNTDEGPGPFARYGSGAECAAKLGKDTPSRTGGTLITIACQRLYEPGWVFRPQ